MSKDREGKMAPKLNKSQIIRNSFDVRPKATGEREPRGWGDVLFEPGD